jgi:hopanoid-associated phosphorylase
MPFSDAQKTDGGAVIAVCGMAFEAAIAAGPGVATLCGLGSAELTARLEDLLAQGAPPCLGIVSFGTAGGLDPALPPGACMLADAVIGPEGSYPVDADWRRALQACLPESVAGTLAGVNHPIRDAADKARLWQSSGARAVDMESHRAALIAHRHGVRFAACRVVVDPAARSLPQAATVGLREDGTMSLLRILRSLAAHPAEVAGLMRLAVDAGAARRALQTVRLRTGAAFAVPRK